MTNENNEEVAIDEEIQDEEVEETEETETTDWKAEALKAQAIAKRYKTKIEKAKETKPVVTEVKSEVKLDNTQKSNELDFGQKAFLKAYGIAGADELALVKNWTTRTGDDLDVLVGDEIFIAKLEALREAKAVASAIPSGTKRSAASTKDSVDYHLEKYENGSMKLDEMPFNMREKVLTAKLEKDRNSSSFNFSS